MKKFFIAIVLLLIIGVFAAYGLLFTQPGNNLLKGVVQSKLSEKLQMPINVNKFLLRTSKIILNFNSPNALSVNIDADFTLFGKDINGKVTTKILDFSKFEKFVQKKLSGKCNIITDINGNLNKELVINVTSNIFEGNTKIKINLINKKLKNLFYEAKNLRIASIIKFLNYNNYATGIIDSRGKFDFLNMKGEGKTFFIGNLVASTIKKDFQVGLPYTKFKGEILNNLKDNKIFTVANIYSSLANLKLDKTIFNLKDKSLSSHYVVELFNLALFNNITNWKFEGKGKIYGNVNYNLVNKEVKLDLTFKENKYDIITDINGNLNKEVNINVASNIFDGDTKIKINLLNQKLKNLFYEAKNLNISSIIKFLNYNNYATGVIDSHGKFDFLNMKGEGKTLFHGNLVASTVKKDFQVDLPYTKFKGEILNNLKDNKIFTVANIYSSLANLKLDKTIFNFKDKSLISHYIVDLFNLALFNKMADQKFVGKGKVEGNLKYTKSIFTEGLVYINKNKLNYRLTYPELVITSDKFDSMDILKTISYPQIFKTFANINLKYNLLNKKGKLNLTFKKGVLQNTKLFKTVKKITGVDLALEVYKDGFLTTDINDKLLKNVFELKSKKTKISSDKTIIDLNKSIIDSLIHFDILGLGIKIFITGNLNKPDIKTDLSDIFKNQLVPQNVEKNIKEIKSNVKKQSKVIKKELKGIKKQSKDIKKQIKNIKKNLFNNFK